MQRLLLLIPSFWCILFSFSGYAQNKFTISGYIKDGKNGEELIGATIYSKEASQGASTNAYGFYSLTLPEGIHTLIYSYVGFQSQEKLVDLKANTKIDIEIKETENKLEEVIITERKPEDNTKGMQMSVNKLEMKDIAKMPALLGEVDVIRSIQLLPGVSTVGEGASGFNVRGGSIDQNLILIDEAPVYNSSHLFGLFSVFNPDAVKDVKLYKGGIPAMFGGRLSSILDVRLKEGNSKRIAVQGGVGFVFSRLTIEAPINKGKGSFIVAGRRSYVDVLASPYTSSTEDFKGLKLYFYDLTAKANYNINIRNKVFLSGYLGRDVFGVSSFGFNWGNTTLSARWNHLFSDKIFMNLTSFYSNYDYTIGAETSANGDGFKWKSNIINYSIKPDFTYYANTKNTINFGGQSLFYTFLPGDATFTSNSISNRIVTPEKYAWENAVYLSNEQTINRKLSINYGLRYSHFNYIGEGEKQTYSETRDPITYKRDLINTEKISSFQNIQEYGNLEPRFSAKYELNDISSIKTSYMRTSQYIHLLSNTAASIPLDVWTPSSNNIKPQIADQVALGYFRDINYKNHQFEASVEGYYKNLQNQIDYINGADLLLNPRLDGELLTGRGRAYGAEFYLKKKSGQLTGWISYTLGRTERQVDLVNNNNWYPNRFDKTHNLSIVMNYQLKSKWFIFNDRWSFSSNISYGSGTPVNLPNKKYTIETYTAGHDPSASRNNIRIPPYFRIDITATLSSKKKNYKAEEIPSQFFKAIKYRYEWELVLGFYNILGRRNAFAIYPEQDAVTQHNRYVQFSLLGAPIPAFTYNFKF